MSGERTSIKRNFAYQMIYEALTLLLPLVTSPYIARVIGAEGLGIYSYTYSIAYYFVLFSMLGLKNYGNRVIAQCRDDSDKCDKAFSNILALHVLISLFCCMAYGVYIWMLKGERLYALIQYAYVLSGLFDISWFFFGMEKFGLTVARSAAIKILSVIGIFLFVRGADDLWIYCLIMSAGILLSQAALWIPLRKYVHFVCPKWKFMRGHIKPLLLLFLPTIAISLYKYMDKVMLGSIGSKTELGFYENAERVTSVSITLISAFGTVMLPRMSYLMHLPGEKDVQKYITFSMRYVMCLAFALAFGLAGVGEVFAPVFWGEKFRFSGILVMELSVTIPFLAFANVIRTQFLIPAEKDHEYLFSVIAGAIVNLCVNYSLIPFKGAEGAAIGTIAAEATVCLVQVWEIRKYLPVRIYIQNAVPFFLIGMLMFISVFLYGHSRFASVAVLMTQIGMGVVIYSVLSFGYLYIVRDNFLTDTIQKMRMKFHA